MTIVFLDINCMTGLQDQIGPSDSFFICFLLHLSGTVFLTIFSRVLIFSITVIFFTLI